MSQVPTLDDWIQRIKSRDAMTFEHAYWGARPEVGEAVPRLILELQAAADPYEQGKLLELLGEYGGSVAVAELRKWLGDQVQGTRIWAAVSLIEAGISPEDPDLVEYRARHPEDGV